MGLVGCVCILISRYRGELLEQSNTLRWSGNIGILYVEIHNPIHLSLGHVRVSLVPNCLSSMSLPYSEVSQDEEKLLPSCESSDGESSPGKLRSRQIFLGNQVSRFSNALHWVAHGVTIVLLCILLLDQRRSSSSKNLNTLYSKNICQHCSR